MSKAYRKLKNNGFGEVSFDEAFPFLCTKKHVVSLVGAGGKTTLMYALAEMCCQKGYRTLVTTTTHIQKPKADLWIHNTAELERQWQRGKIAVAGTAELTGSKEPKREGHQKVLTSTEKITSPDPDSLNQYIKLADITFIEADGAKRMPCKVPNAAEPVILPQTDIVIGVMGMEIIGRPLSEVCFRAEEAVRLLRVTQQHRVTMEDMVRILTAEDGTRKAVGNREYYVVLNKCDQAQCLKAGKEMAGLLENQGVNHTILTSFCEEAEMGNREKQKKQKTQEEQQI